MRRLVFVLALSLVLAFPAAAGAQDWLAVLPECGAAPRGSEPSFAWVYPRAGLPALVEAGQSLVARVRLPVALTPPPGIQQPRALVGFSAELVGRPWPLPGAPRHSELRHPLAVVDVRPDASSTLVYRVALPIPAWVAPGTYDLALEAPGGRGVARALVRVLAKGRAVRVGYFGGDELPSSAGVGVAPIDVGIADDAGAGAGASGVREDAADEAERPTAAPVLAASGLVAGLRLGTSLWVFGRCDAALAQRAFEEERSAIVAGERRDEVAFAAGSSSRARERFGSEARPWPDSTPLHVDAQAGALVLALDASFPFASAEWLVRLPEAGSAFASEGLEFSPFPEGEPWPAHGATTRVALLRLRAGAQGTLRSWQAHALEPRLLLPERADSFAPIALRIGGAPEGSRAAFRFDERRTAFGPTSIQTSFGALGPHRVEALVVTRDGRQRSLSGSVRIRTARASGCRSAPSTAECSPWWFAPVLLHLRRRGRTLRPKGA